ncbi:MAG TPA: metallophosphoesterase [Methanobacterium sp.]|nr:metallophosphoesterase [Methanobacterium sp.]
MKVNRHILISINYAVMFLLINYGIFYGLSSLFNLPRNELYYIILIIVALSHPISILLLRFSSNILVRFLYAASAAWLGTSAYLLIAFAIYLLISPLKLPTQTTGSILIATALVIGVYALFNVTRLKVKEINIPLKGIKEDIRAVQISDVHIGPIRNKGFVKNMVDKIINLKPEVVFITGDIFDGSSKLDLNILEDFKRIKVPILFIMGNHDFYQGYEEVSAYMDVAHINILYNQVYQFRDVQVIGVPFSWDRTYLNQTIGKIDFDKDKPAILLYHLPRGFEAAKEAGIDLQLSGHTHAGQFYPFNLFVKLMFPYIRGLYKKEGSYLYVSQGTGTLGPPMRLGSRCEITLINLKLE